MASLRSFVYLDDQKMYSLASQVFEGLVSRYVESEVTAKELEEAQKGPVASGKLMADILRTTKGRQEDRFLHDYLFTLFEDHLIQSGRLKELTAENGPSIQPLQLIKARGRAKFNDFKLMAATTAKFNEIGEALTYLSTHALRQAAEQEIASQVSAVKDRNQRAKAQVRAANELKSQIRKAAEGAGLHIDATMLTHFQTIVQYGVEGMLEVQISAPSGTVTAVLDRSRLKDQERLVTDRYSRLTEAPFCLVGIVAQTPSYEGSMPETAEQDSTTSMRSALRKMVNALVGVELAFGKGPGETVVDPIALYVEI